jgi:hypothetical protein
VVAFLPAMFFAKVPVNSFNSTFTEVPTSVSSPELIHAGIAFIFAIAFGVIGLLLRSGKRGPAVAGIVVSMLASLYLLATAIIVVRNAANNGGGGAGHLLFVVAFLGAVIVQLILLFQAAAIAPHLEAVRRGPATPADAERPKS